MAHIQWSKVQWSEDTRFFVDTSSLMEDAAAHCVWRYVDPIRRCHGIPPLIVAKSVVDEITRLKTTSKTHDTSRQAKARAAWKVVTDLLANDSVQIVGEDNDDSFADNQFQIIFTQLRRKYQLVLFTQDRSLAKDILSLNHSDSVKYIKHIEAFRIGKDGAPERWMLDDHGLKGVKSHPPKSQAGLRIATPQVGGATTLNDVRPFELRERSRRKDNTLVDTPIPVTGEIVTNSDGHSLRLMKSLGTGGEGTAYETNDSRFVCKIYRHDRLKKSVIEKLKLMTSRRIRHPAICWPMSLAYNSDREVVGYIMPKGQGKELKRGIFIKPILMNTFPAWTRLHVVKLTSKILDAVAYLHSLNVLLGDINPGNPIVA